MRAAERPQSVGGGHCIEISSMCVRYATITAYPGHHDNDNKRFKGVDCASRVVHAVVVVAAALP